MRTGWEDIALGDLTAHRPICYGVLKPGERQSAGVPLIRITDIKTDHLDESQLYRIAPALSAEFKRSVLEGGEVLLSIQGTIGRVAICPPHLKGANISRTIAQISPDARISRPFLRYWLLSLNGDFPTGGATRDSLNIGALRELIAPVPSIPEQQRIVSILDEALEAIATARVSTVQNMRNARALFARERDIRFSWRGTGWQLSYLGDVCNFQRGLTYSKEDEVDQSDNVVLRAMNIDLETHRLDFSELRHLSSRVLIPETKKVKKGSLLICTASGSKSHLGKVAFIDEDYGYAFGGFMGLLTPHDDLDPRYLYYLMTSGAYNNFIGALAAGMNINNLKFDDLKRFEVPYPLIDEQRRIVRRLEALQAETERLHAIYEQKVAALDALKESMLHEAFTGAL